MPHNAKVTVKTISFMKKPHYYIIAAATAVMTVFAGCSENETPVFDKEYSALNIWFGTDNGTSFTVLDSTVYNYSYSLEEGSVTFNARTIGVPVDYDRTFTLEAYKGDTDLAEGSFSTDTYTIKAGETSAECKITFDTSKLKDTDAFTEQDGHLYFRVVEGSDFQPGTENMNSLCVVLKNYLAEPTEWNSATYPHMTWARYFGAYSRVKYQFMIQILGMQDFTINYRATTAYDKENNEISSNYASYLAERMAMALEEYNNTHDTPLTDETGALVTF